MQRHSLIHAAKLSIADMTKIFLCLIAALVCCSFVSTADPVETATVKAGEPFILNFGYSGPTDSISYDLTKDGQKVTVDNIRTFKQLDKLYFTEINELDSGKYHFTSTERGTDFQKTIILSG